MGWLSNILNRNGNRQSGAEPRRSVPPPLPTASTKRADVAPQTHEAQSATAPPKQPVTIDSLRWVGLGQSIKLSSIGEMRSPLIYLGDSRRMPSLPPEVIDLARNIAKPDSLPALPQMQGYGQMSRAHRFAYLAWIASGRTSAPPMLAFAELHIAGLERRLLIDGKDVIPISEELFRQLGILQTSGLAGASSLCERISSLLWYLTILDPKRVDATHVRMLVYATPKWTRETLGAMLGWFWATNSELPSWAAIVAARAHESATPFDGTVGPTSPVFGRFDAFYTPRHRRVLQSILATEHSFQYEPINPAVGNRRCLAMNPWLDQRPLTHLARCWNEAIKPPAPEITPMAPFETEARQQKRNTLADFASAHADRLRNERPPEPVAAKPPPLPRQGLVWMGPDEPLRITGLGTIQKPMCYVFFPNGQPTPEPAAIIADAQVHTEAYQPPNERELPYWPRFYDLNDRQRRYYIDWHIAGRISPPTELGYTFLHIYGLERRSLLDGDNIVEVFDEVLRLKALYDSSSCPSSSSFDSYTDSFLWFLVVRHPDRLEHARIVSLFAATKRWSEDYFASLLTWHARNGLALDGEAAFKLTAHLPEAMQSVVVTRVAREMNQLFLSRFAEQYPKGLEPRVSKREHVFAYRPASAALMAMEVRHASPWGVQSQFKPLVELWNACVEDLRKLSSVRRGNSVELTPESWSALPVELKCGVDHPLLNSLIAFLSTCATNDGHTAVPAQSLAKALKLEGFSRLTPAKARKLAEVVAELSYCLEPDARMTGRGYDATELLAIYHEAPSCQTDPARWALASAMLVVGMVLANADGDAHESEIALLNQQILSSFELNDSEMRRLAARSALLKRTGVEVGDVTAPLRKLDAAHRALMARLILAMVAADGTVTDSELKAVRRLYVTLGFSTTETEQAIRSFESAADANDLVEVTPREKGSDGEAIPKPPTRVPALQLDRVAIAAIMKDTHEVAQMLAQAMNLESVESTIEVEPASTANESSGNETALPTRFAAFYQVVISRPSWTQAELANLAREHGLMLSGAIDAINDWSTQQHGGPMVHDDGGQYSLETSYFN